jgi:aminoglycoside phosphotransferase (APT) family kinase protein
MRMHSDEVATDVGLVRRLLAAQFPDWAELPVEPLQPWGTDNALYRLGADKIVRLPRRERTAPGVAHDARWLPRIAPHLPVPISVPLALGSPGDGYEWTWGVYPWLDGETPPPDADQRGSLVDDVVGFVRALHSVDIPDGPEAFRAGPLAPREEAVRDALAQLEGVIDTDAAAALWEETRDAPQWDGPPVWIHGDLLPGNVLLRDGRLAGVIDWSGFGVGDPAADMLAAWALFDAAGREAFRAQLGVDDDTWTRGRGWALSVGLIALPYYVETYPQLAETARRLIREALS